MSAVHIFFKTMMTVYSPLKIVIAYLQLTNMTAVCLLFEK